MRHIRETTSDNSWFHKANTSNSSPISSTINKPAKECDGADMNIGQNTESQSLETIWKDQGFPVVEMENLQLQLYRDIFHTFGILQLSYVVNMERKLAPIL